MDDRPVNAIRNLGTGMAAAFARAGITKAAEIEALGADGAYAKLIAAGERPHILAFQAVALGLEGRHWNSAEAAEKAALRQRFDALRRGEAPAPARKAAPSRGRQDGQRLSAEMEAQLDSLGLPAQPKSTGRRRR
ncbi:MAG: TfoX/Sxy family DNA transformation protein [Pseudomonadota bacterium]